MEYTAEEVNGGLKSILQNLLIWIDPDNTIDPDYSHILYSSPSRQGPTIGFIDPVLIQYSDPLKRVLLNSARDANPFFHLYEALWMLNGNNDVESLKYFTSKIADLASDDGITFNGAYGYRWRNGRINGGRIDQLWYLADHLQRVPTSRRAVLQMWNTQDDMYRIDTSKDVCCNLSVIFVIRNGCLDMTVTNRSNDLIWGMLGANYVHFTILQEYMAARIGVKVGVYNHFTTNLHFYTERHPYSYLNDIDNIYSFDADRYGMGLVSFLDSYVPVPLCKDLRTFDKELEVFVANNSKHTGLGGMYMEPFLQTVAQPMMDVYHLYKAGNTAKAMEFCNSIKDMAWQYACREWLEVRANAKSGS